MRIRFFSMIAGALSLVAVSGAQAALVSSDGACTNSDVQTSAPAGASECIGILSVFEGTPATVNDSAELFNVTPIYTSGGSEDGPWASTGSDGNGPFGTGFFGRTDWAFAYKDDFGDPDSDGGLGLTFDVTDNSPAGNWSIGGPNRGNYSHFLLAFKQSTELSTYYFTLEQMLAGDWNGTFGGIDGFNSLSHASLYVSGFSETQIPEPTTLALLGLGLLGIGLMRRRRA